MIEHHCLIVGAGAFGVSAAIELRRRGHAVTLMDPGPLPHPDAASTDISKIVRMDYGGDELYTALMERALPAWRGYGGSLFHELGFAVLSGVPLAPGTFEGDSFALLGARGHQLERLDADAIARRFPAWRRGRFVDGYYNPQGGYAESGRVIAMLVARARAQGVTVREGAAVERLLESDARVGGVMVGGEEVRADVVIVAAGAWTPVLVPELAGTLTPVAQSVFHLAPADGELYGPPRMVPWTGDIQKSGWYGFPVNANGVVKIANHGPGTIADPRGPRVVAPGVEARLREFLADALPSLADAPVAARRVCFYCDTPDGDFLIDHDPSRPGLVVATGGSGHAFKFTPILGEIVADVVEHRPGPEAARFAWRTGVKPRAEAARARQG